jgi:DNA-binding FadR family transcriptional regulator
VFPTIEGWPAQSVADHQRILAALRAHDGDGARAAMSDHLAAGATPLIEHLVKQGVAERVAPVDGRG